MRSCDYFGRITDQPTNIVPTIAWPLHGPRFAWGDSDVILSIPVQQLLPPRWRHTMLQQRNVQRTRQDDGNEQYSGHNKFTSHPRYLNLWHCMNLAFV